MTQPLNKGSLFPEVLIPELINLVKGESALAQLTGASPIPFNGSKEFTFTFDKEVDIVAESGAKSHGGVTIEPVTIMPLKFEYGARISDEFMYGSQEYQINVLQAFSEGFAKKIARGIDIAAIHGFNPRTGVASALIGGNNFKSKITQIVELTENPDNDMEAAIALVEAADGNISGAAFAPAFRSSLAALKDSTGRKLFPELAWGQKVGSINGLPVTSNPTIAFGGSGIRAIAGDFSNSFKWGYAKQIPMKIIEYGNPDNDEVTGDLQGHNQIYVRAEAYVGWGILIPAYFALIEAGE